MPKQRNYKAYPFTGQDPIIEKLRLLVGNKPYSEVAEASGVSSQTLYNWFRWKKVKRPQFAAVVAVAHACGAQITVERRQAAKIIKFRRKPNA